MKSKLALLQALVEVAVGQLAGCAARASWTRRGVKPRETSARSRLLARRVHAEERHHLVRVRAPGRLRSIETPQRVGVGALGRGTPRARRRGGTAPRSRGSGCGAAARARAAARRSGRGPPGTRSRRGPARAAGCVIVMRCPLQDRGHHGVEAVGQVVVGDQPHPGLQQRAGQGEGQGVEQLGGRPRRRAPAGSGR